MVQDVIKQDQEKLLQFITGASEHLLKKNGEFFPIAATLSQDGKISPVYYQSDETRPESKKVIVELKKVINSDKEKVIAAAIAYEMLISRPPDTVKKDVISVSIDHKESSPITLFYPYEPKKNGTIFYDQMFGVKEYEKIFES